MLDANVLATTVRTVVNKYHARKVFGTSGRLYASGAERDYAEELQLRVRSGDITDLCEQPRLELEPGVFWRLDFSYREVPSGLLVHVDVKGCETEVFRLKCRLYRLHGPGPLYIVKRDGRKHAFKITRIILPKGREET